MYIVPLNPFRYLYDNIIFKYFCQYSRLHFLRLYFANIRGQIREQVDRYSDIFLFFLTFTYRYSPICHDTCKFFPLVFYGTIGASLMSLSIVTINRACMLYFPEKVDKVGAGLDDS